MKNYLSMMLEGASMVMTANGKYHILYKGVKHVLDVFDASRIRKHPSIKKSRSNVWVRRKPRFRSGASHRF
ncbi:hypothetical protein SIPHO063v1_p0013 [Vibrio phage PS10B.1]|nr:hypothetical protein SIPHO063v1_p0013 [Vibrio phage PS10B.1]QZI89540.1 hypothetical protein SIPHO076v1_p0007 [Vibrio phage PS34B.1]